MLSESKIGDLPHLRLSYIQKWTDTYGFTLDIIEEACSRTISATHQPSFEYADTILTRWHKSHVHHLKDISVLDDAYQKQKAVSAASAQRQNLSPEI